MRRAIAIVGIGISAGIGIGIASAQVRLQTSPTPPKARVEAPPSRMPEAESAPVTKPAPSAQAPTPGASPNATGNSARDNTPRNNAPRDSVNRPASAAVDKLQYVDAQTTPDPALEQAILDYLSPELACGLETQVRYLHNEVDLNGDGLQEAIAYLIGPQTCGTGGCTTLVYEPTEAGYELVSYLTLVNYPIVVSDETTQGWHDLVLMVEGGGATPGYRRLKYDGTAYPSNPSTQPSVADGEVSGKAFVVEASNDYDAAPKLAAPRCQ
ncbi:MAG: hypothetical protein ACFB8W_19020 [Elainellaceae cyanobacterium]